MEKFIKKYFLPSEKLVYQSHHHWINYFSLRSLLSLGLIPFAQIKSEKFLITDQRIIIKKGILLIDTFEITYRKIESVELYQTLTGRIFNYGDVHIIGTGGTKYIVDSIKQPLKFKQKIQELENTETWEN